jgi:hypothetical protein
VASAVLAVLPASPAVTLVGLLLAALKYKNLKYII